MSPKVVYVDNDVLLVVQLFNKSYFELVLV